MVGQRRLVRGNFDEEHVHVGILENEMMMPLVAHGDWNGGRSRSLRCDRYGEDDNGREKIDEPPQGRKVKHAKPYIL